MNEQSPDFISETRKKFLSYLSRTNEQPASEASAFMPDILNYVNALEMQIAELLKNQQLFDKERAYFNDIFDNQPVGLYRIRTFNTKKRVGKSWTDSLNPAYILEFATDKFCEQLGITRAEFNHNPYIIGDLVHPDDRESFEKTNEKANKKIIQFRWVGRLLLKDKVTWVRLESLPTKMQNGDIVWTGVLTDISEQKAAEEALSNSNLQLEDVLEGANIGTLEWNIQTGKLKFNKIWAKNLGYKVAEIKIGTLLFGKKGWKAITHPDDIPFAEEMLLRHFSGELPYHRVEVRMRHKKGHWVWIRQEGKVKTWTPDGEPLLMYGVHTDISAQKEAEIELFNLNEQLEERIAERTSELTKLNTSLKESENKLLGITMEVEERERNRFSAELHDGMGPLLSTIKLYFQWLSETTDVDKRKLITEKGNYSIEMAIKTARELARGLSSQYLKEVGFINAIIDFTQRINDTNKIAIAFETNSYLRFGDIVELTLYRITTELIKNTLTYANATQATITFLYNNDTKIIEYSYSDNGKGFVVEKTLNENSGFGFISIRQRVEVMKGTIKINSTDGKGMSAFIEVPVDTIS